MSSTWPTMVRVEQRFAHPRVDDPASAAIGALASAIADPTSLRDRRVAISVGSRGIANIAAIVRAVAGRLRAWGADPFIVPSMGSHGGGTAEGQRAVLASLGVTEESIGAPVISSMEVVEIGTTADGFPVLLDREATCAGGIVVVNRVKPHTEFTGPYQSGLLKMLLIGLGKHEGAIRYHAAATRIPFERLIRTAAALVLERASVVAGIAILENGYDETAEMVGVRPADFLDAEPALLDRATRYLPLVPFDDVDLLIIDRMGKNISGAGMDTNVLRRKHWADVAHGEQVDPAGPKRIFVRDLTSESAGNAAGIGLADFALSRLVEKIDRHKTYTNTITATRPRGAMLPLVFDTDEEAIRLALLSAGVGDPSTARIARIRDTLHLAHMEVSEPLLNRAKPGADVRAIEKSAIAFDERGMLVPDVIDG